MKPGRLSSGDLKLQRWNPSVWCSWWRAHGAVLPAANGRLDTRRAATEVAASVRLPTASLQRGRWDFRLLQVASQAAGHNTHRNWVPGCRCSQKQRGCCHPPVPPPHTRCSLRGLRSSHRNTQHRRQQVCLPLVQVLRTVHHSIHRPSAAVTPHSGPRRLQRTDSVQMRVRRCAGFVAPHSARR